MSEGKKYTKEEYEKLYKKGRGILMDYLAEITEGKFTEEEYMPLQKKHFFRVIGDEYKRLMQEDEPFFRAVEEFCSERRFKSEKRSFCRQMVTRMVTSGEIHRNYSKKTMEIDALPEYPVPAHHRL